MSKMIPANDKNLFFSPYTWQDRGNGRFTARMPGAYLKIKTERTSSLSVLIDRTENAGCPAEAMPVMEISLDNAPVQIIPVPAWDQSDDPLYELPIIQNGNPTVIHSAEINFRASNLMRKRWFNPDTHLTVVGIALNEEGHLLPPAPRPRLAIGFGDSITEGVGAEKTFVSWNDLSANRSAGSWFPLLCAALGCEYGQLGTGGQGLILDTYTMRSLVHTWDQFTEGVSRLDHGLLLPEPDYVFCAMGTNDFDQTTKIPFQIEADAEKWLTNVRNACPHARIYWLIPPLGQHESEIRRAVDRRNASGDDLVWIIDTSPVRNGFDITGKPSRYAGDGIHPGPEGNAILAALASGTVNQTLVTDPQIQKMGSNAYILCKQNNRLNINIRKKSK